ncbi:MAG TPA: hypothetical protein VJ063_03940 [Verrucomicrobiae bacterium]|nr:hypothetical protein [Verrucomicrobiae bacterium]
MLFWPVGLRGQFNQNGTRNGAVAPGPPTIHEEKDVGGGSPLLFAFQREWAAWKGRPRVASSKHDFHIEVRSGEGSVWILIQWPSGARMICCAAYCAGGGHIRECRNRDGTVELLVDSPAGIFGVKITLPDKKPLLRWETTFTPYYSTVIPYWPADLYPVDCAFSPLNTRGLVHTKQVGPRAALLYATLTRPEAGSFLYMQNLSALNDYFNRTGASAADRISDRWPELGFTLPPCTRGCLPKDTPVRISDAFLLLSKATPADELESSRLFLDLYAELYLEYPRPPATYRDWPRRVDETIHDLAHSPVCTVKRRGHRYVLAYAAYEDAPPESVVQLAVLLPLIEYARSRDLKIPLITELRANIPTFFNSRLGSVMRWLPGEEHLCADVMDAWYLYHTYLNLARLAEYGDRTAKKLFTHSLRYGVKVARHFNYHWPILYNIYNFEVVRRERGPGQGGEADVGAQYIHVMQQAWSLTRDRTFIEEAERAAQALVGFGFNLGYQYNNTAFGAGGLLWLWRKTGKELYRQLSDSCMASILQNLWLWECRYGYGQNFQSFMGLPPLRTAPYLALYEELEMLAAFHEYLGAASEDAPPALRVLLPEYCKYLIDRAWQHYPSEIPREMLADKPGKGILDRKLSIPVEDIRDGWDKAGQVGQQVYGAAAPFVFATRHCHEVKGQDFNMHTDVPIADYRVGKQSKNKGTVRFRALGDSRCSCHVRIVARDFIPLPDVRLKNNGKAVKGELTRFGYLEFELPADASVTLTWRVIQPKVKQRPGIAKRISEVPRLPHRNGEPVEV